MSCGPTTPAREPVQTQINDLINDPRIVEAINRNMELLRNAGIRSVNIEQRTRPNERFAPNEQSNMIVNGIRGIYVTDGNIVETNIQPVGGHTPAVNAAMLAIREELGKSGVGDFQAASILRCPGSPIRISSEQIVR